jgi:hypothetical protein
VILRSTGELQQIPVRVVQPIGGAQLDAALPLGLFHFPLLDFQLRLSANRVPAAPHFDSHQTVRDLLELHLFEAAVYYYDGTPGVLPRPQPVRISSNRRVQIQHLRTLLQHLKLGEQLYDGGVLAAPVVDRLLPLVGGGHAEHLVVLGLEEAQSGTLVREHVVQESIGAETHVVGVVQHDPMGGHRAQELREERGARQAYAAVTGGVGLLRPGVDGREGPRQQPRHAHVEEVRVFLTERRRVFQNRSGQLQT